MTQTLFRALLVLCIPVLWGAALADAGDPGVIHSRRLPSGIPVGGVGTGAFHLMTDGTLSHALLTNNWSHASGALHACFAAVRVQSDQRTVARVLALRNTYGLPVVPELLCDALFPQVTFEFPDATPPVDVSLRVFSPLIPHDPGNASMPGAVFLFRVRNPSPLPVEIALALSWENLLGVGGTRATGPFANRTGNTVVPMPAAEGYFGLRLMARERANARETRQRLTANASGEIVLMTRPPRGQAVVTTAGWNALDARPGWWDRFAAEGVVTGSVGTGVEHQVHPAGVVAVRLTLRPDDFVEVPFAVAWYTPRLYTLSGVDFGHYYQNFWPDAVAVGRRLLAEWRTLYTLTDEWQKRLLFSNLPPLPVRRLINSVALLATHTLHTRDGQFVFLQPQIEAAGEHRISVEQQIALAALLLTFFPQWSAQRLMQMSANLEPDGLLAAPHTWEQTLDRFRPLSPPMPFEERPLVDEGKMSEASDGARGRPREDSKEAVVSPIAVSVRDTCALIVQVAQHVLWTGDRTLLDRVYNDLRRAILAVLTTGDLADMPSVGQARDERVWQHVALQAGRRLAVAAGDEKTAHACAEALARAAALAGRGLPQEKTGLDLLVSVPDLHTIMASIGAMRPDLWMPSASPIRAADWLALQAQAGMELDLLAGHMTVLPRVPPGRRNVILPLFAPTFWAKLEYRPSARGGMLTLRIDRLMGGAAMSGQEGTGRAKLTLRTLRVPGPPRPVPPQFSVFVSVGQTPIGHRFIREPEGHLLLTLDVPLSLDAGDRLEILVR
ncbi:MAG: GH116 family glycosyl-hydrolase [Chloroherpetonaceae bacterium]|nr:GH116 family glycosyl-hydrolase [Chloroherpetonaceae bacterium]